MMKNTQWKWCHRSLISAVVFAAICISALEFIDGMSGGFAVAFIAFFLAIASIAVAALFFSRAKLMDGILNSEGLLACWKYSQDESEQSARREYEDYRERNRAMLIVIGGMLVLAAALMMIFAGEGGLITGVFLIAFAAFLFIVSRVTPALALKNALAATKEAFIAKNGIIYEGAVYPFRSFLMNMEKVTFSEKDGEKPAVLTFSFCQLIGLNISSAFEIEIPVPHGEEKAAREIADIIEASSNQGAS